MILSHMTHMTVGPRPNRERRSRWLTKACQTREQETAQSMCYLSQSSPYSVAPQRSRKDLKTKVIDYVGTNRPGAVVKSFNSVSIWKGPDRSVAKGEISCLGILPLP